MADSKDYKVKIATEADTAQLVTYNAELGVTKERIDAINKDDADIAEFTKGSSAKIDDVSESVEKLGDKIDDTKGKVNDTAEALKDNLGKAGADATGELLSKTLATTIAFETLRPLVEALAVEIGKFFYGDGWERQVKNAEASAAAYGKMSSNLTDVREQQEKFQASVHDTKNELDATLGVYQQIAKQFADKQRRDAEVRSAQAENDKVGVDERVAAGDISEEEGIREKELIDEEKRKADHHDKIMTLKNQEALLQAEQERVIAAGLEIDRQKTEAIARNKAAQQVEALKSDLDPDVAAHDRLLKQKEALEKEVEEKGKSGSPIDQLDAHLKQSVLDNVTRKMTELADRIDATTAKIDAAAGGRTDLGSAADEQKSALAKIAKSDSELEALKQKSQTIANQQQAINPNIRAEEEKFAISEDTRSRKSGLAFDKRANQEEDATAKGLAGQNKAGEKALIEGLNDLGKAQNKSTADGQKAAEEIKKAAQALADGGTADELSKAASVLEQYGNRTDSNVQRLLAVAEANMTRAEAIESRIKNLETKAARSSALSSN